MCFSWQNLAKAPSAKFVSLSVITLCGYPYLKIISLRNFTDVVLSHFFIGFTSIHFVNLSTMTKMWVIPPRSGLNGPTISKHHTENGQVIGIIFNSDDGICILLAYLWQPLHFSTSFLAFFNAVGQ